MTIITRSQWGARPPRQRTRMGVARGVARHYEGVALGRYDHSSCAQRVRSIQNNHMDRQGWDDIAYSFLVCRHGAAFEGRWANTRTAANGTNAGNGGYYAGCILMGPGDELTPEAVMGWLEARAELRRLTGSGPETPPHSALFNTACPGDLFRSYALDGMTFIPPLALAPVSLAPNDYSVEAIVAAMPILRQGSKGQHVQILQGLVTANGRALRTDGDFGPDTASKLKEWQRACGLVDDAVAGPVTWRRLMCV